MINSKYAPSAQSQYSSKDLNAAFIGKSFIATKNAQTLCEHKVIDDSIVDGGRIITTNTVAGDNLTCQIVDKEYVYAGILYPPNYNGTEWSVAQPNGVVLNEFITNWYLTPAANLQWDFTINYPAKIYGGLYVRVIYTSVGTENDVNLYINYKLHKILW